MHSKHFYIDFSDSLIILVMTQILLFFVKCTKIFTSMLNLQYDFGQVGVTQLVRLPRVSDLMTVMSICRYALWKDISLEFFCKYFVLVRQ